MQVTGLLGHSAFRFYLLELGLVAWAYHSSHQVVSLIKGSKVVLFWVVYSNP